MEGAPKLLSVACSLGLRSVASTFTVAFIGAIVKFQTNDTIVLWNCFLDSV